MAKGAIGSRKRSRNEDLVGGSDNGVKTPRVGKTFRSSTDEKGQAKTKLNRAVHQIKRMFLAQANVWKKFADSLEQEPEPVMDQQPWVASIDPEDGRPTAIFAQHIPETKIQAEVRDLKQRLHHVRMHVFEREAVPEVEEDNPDTNGVGMEKQWQALVGDDHNKPMAETIGYDEISPEVDESYPETNGFGNEENHQDFVGDSTKRTAHTNDYDDEGVIFSV
jgi:hypothetical protein